MVTQKQVRIRGEGFFLLSAPHNVQVDRLGKPHLAEINITRIMNKLEKKLGKKKISTITWKSKYLQKTKKKKILRDPNYYSKNKIEENPWYQFFQKKLEEAKSEGKEDKLFLIDLHGMNDDKQYDIIIGFRALKKYITPKIHTRIISNLLEVMETFGNKYKLKIGYNVIFKGFINEKYYTVCQQSNSLGIPGIQIELSKSLRNRLVKKDIFFTNFARTLHNLYKLNQK